MYKLKTAVEIDLSFDQIVSIVQKLPSKQKIKLSKELEKEAINSKLKYLLKTFNNPDVDLQIIEDEVEIVRQQIYDEKK